MEDKVATKFTCKCGKQTGWISEGEYSVPCPSCGRRYEGIYDKKLCTIKAKEIKYEGTKGGYMRKIIEWLRLTLLRVLYAINFIFLPNEKKRYWKGKFNGLKTFDPKNRVLHNVATRRKFVKEKS